MLKNYEEAEQKALRSLENGKFTIQVKSLLQQMAKDITLLRKEGDWSSAVRLAYYRHEFAKIFGCNDYYNAFLELRKIQDQIIIMRDS